jgi:hypothetical protein
MNSIICTAVFLLHLLLRNSYSDQRFIVGGLAQGAAPTLHCCGWRVQNLEESSILKHSKVSWIISLLLAWFIALSGDYGLFLPPS